MPLLDHFHPPMAPRRHWESFHVNWAGAIADDWHDVRTVLLGVIESLFPRSLVRIRVFQRQPLGGGGGVQLGIRRNEDQRRNLQPDFKRRRQLHGIVSPERHAYRPEVRRVATRAR